MLAFTASTETPAAGLGRRLFGIGSPWCLAGSAVSALFVKIALLAFCPCRAIRWRSNMRGAPVSSQARALRMTAPKKNPATVRAAGKAR